MLKKRTLAIIATVAVLMSAGVLTAQKRQVVLDRVVAVVGGSAILHSEVETYANMLVEQRRQQGYTSDRDPMNESLEGLMRQKLLYSQALIDSLTPPSVDAYVEEQMQAMIAEAGSIAELETRQHMAIFNYREILRQRLTEQEYARAMQQQVISNITVTPGEVEKFFNEMTEEERPLIPEQYVYAQIVRYPASQEDAKRRTRERLLEMRERIISGKSSMAVLARTYSVDPGSAMRGGELSPGPLSQLTKPFADALAKLKPGQISEVVESEFGFHIIELIDEPKNGMYHSRHILLRPSYTNDELIAPMKELDSIANLIRKDSLTFEAAALAHSDDKHSKQNGGIVTNHDLLEHYSAFDAKLTATKFLKEDFGVGGGKSIDDYNTIRYMKKGDVSTAFRSSDMNGNDLCKIIKLVDIIPSHTATLEEDYLRLEQIALQEKQQQMFQQWLNKKIETMYIYISPEFRDGDFLNKSWVKKDMK